MRYGGLSAYRAAFGSYPMDIYMWHDGDSDLGFAQDASAVETADDGTGSDPEGDSEQHTTALV